MELLEAAAFTEKAVQFLKLGQRLGGREMKHVRLHGGNESIVPCAVGESGIGKPHYLGTTLSDGTYKVV